MYIYSLYWHSSKKWKELKALGETLEEHVVNPTRSQGTRWNNHRKKALAVLASNYRHSPSTKTAGGIWTRQSWNLTAVKWLHQNLSSMKLSVKIYWQNRQNYHWIFRQTSCPFPLSGVGLWHPRLLFSDRGKNLVPISCLLCFQRHSQY